MDLTPNAQQQQIIDAVEAILARNGGYKRTIALIEQDAYDDDLHAKLQEAGFLDVALGPETGPLEAGLVVERLAYGGALMASGATALVFPMVTGETAEGPVGLLRAPGSQAFRFGAQARSVLFLRGEEACRIDLKPGEAKTASNDQTGWLLGRLPESVLSRGKSLGPGSGARLRNWWRTALALELAGTIKGAVDVTTRYVSERIQFGRPIGSFQAVQHRLSELAVRAEGARWLALVAAHNNANDIDAATAATYTTTASPTVLRETHQLHGAMGFTREYHLHVWTMRLPALQLELGGLMSHARDLTKALGASGPLPDIRAKIANAR